MDQSNPADYIKLFVNHKQHLMMFLELQTRVRACCVRTLMRISLSLPPPPQPQVHQSLPDIVYDTLLELYLGEIGSCPKEERKAKETTALELLKRPEVSVCVCVCVCVCGRERGSIVFLCVQATYDIEHALVLAKNHDFREGILYLYEKTNL